MLVLTRKLPLCWLVFILLEGAIHTAGGEKSTSILQAMNAVSYMMTSLVRWSLGCNSGIDVMGAINCFLIGCKASSIRGNACLVLKIWQIAHGWGAHRPQINLLLFC